MPPAEQPAAIVERASSSSARAARPSACGRLGFAHLPAPRRWQRALREAPAWSQRDRDRCVLARSKAADSCDCHLNPGPYIEPAAAAHPRSARPFNSRELQHSMPEVIFPGPEGRLEGRFHPGTRPRAPVALILHSHPQAGRHDEQQDRAAALPDLRQARLRDAALQLPRRRQEPGHVRQRHRRAERRRLARSTGCRASTRKRRPPGSPASASAPGSACSC